MSKITHVWDMLRMETHPEGGGSVACIFQREELNIGDELTSLRRLNNEHGYWPPVKVLLIEDTRIRLEVGYGSDTFMFTLDTEEREAAIEVGTPDYPATLTLSLIFYTLRVEEYDEFAETTVSFLVDDKDWADAEKGDPKAAQSIADEIAEQIPESLEIIAKYMTRAANLGCQDAIDWLMDYYHGDDGRYDAYY